MVDLLKHEHDKARLTVFVRSSSAEPNDKFSLAPSLTLDLCDCGSIPPLRGNEAKREAYLCSCCITPCKVVFFFGLHFSVGRNAALGHFSGVVEAVVWSRAGALL